MIIKNKNKLKITNRTYYIVTNILTHHCTLMLKQLYYAAVGKLLSYAFVGKYHKYKNYIFYRDSPENSMRRLPNSKDDYGRQK